MKIGLDVHGVIDVNPKLFRRLAQMVLEAGGEIHIISGSAIPKLRREIAKYDIPHTHEFSITSHHEDIGTEVTWDEKGPHMDPTLWDRSKAEYCAQNNIDFMIDDSPIYGKYFTTPYLQYGIKVVGGGPSRIKRG